MHEKRRSKRKNVDFKGEIILDDIVYAGTIENISEKDQQVINVGGFREFHQAEAEQHLLKLQQVARERNNTFESLMDAAKACSLGSMSHALYDVGGEYRRNM